MNKTVITCKNFEQELKQATDYKYEYEFHYPLCLDNKNLNKDIVQKIVDEQNLSQYTLMCCDLCASTHKNKEADIKSKSLCFYQLTNKTTIDHYLKQGYYIVTPGWLENWKKYVKEDWEFTREVAKQFFASNCKKVLLLDTLLYQNVEQNLKDFSKYIGKEYDILPVGLDYYKMYIDRNIHSKTQIIEEKEQENKRIKNQLINYTMSVDLVKRLSDFTSEEEIVESIYDILRMMFMPKVICYTPFVKDTLQKKKCKFADPIKMKEFLDSDDIVLWHDNEKGFSSKIFYGDNLIGILSLDEIMFEEYRETYYNTFLSIIHIISLALYNSKLFEEVVTLNKNYEQQKSYFEQLFQNSPDMIIITDKQFVVQNTNDSFNHFFGRRRQFIGHHVNNFFSYYESDYTTIQVPNDKEIKPVTSINFKNQNRYLEVSTYPIMVFKEQVGFYLILSDVTQRIQMQEDLKDMAFKDSLTGLYNRAFCEVEMNRLTSNRQLPFGIIIGDVNGLKVVNDAFGHLAGDELLKQIAQIILKSCRNGDIISRWGGDEFVILLPKTTEDSVKDILSRVQQNCLDFEGYEYVTPSISLGYSVLKKQNKTITQCFVEAENMMYENKLLQKESIRNRIVKSLESSLFEKSYETEEHAIRVAKMCVKVSEYLNMSSQTLTEMELLGRLHDIGKLFIDNALLEKEEPLSDQDRSKIQEHSEAGFRIAKSIGELSHIAEYILSHHEKWDGTGYPNNLKGLQIPIQSRILSIADAIDAMQSDRPYKKSMSNLAIIEELKIHRGSQFDPNLVDVFIELILT